MRAPLYDSRAFVRLFHRKDLLAIMCKMHRIVELEGELSHAYQAALSSIMQGEVAITNVNEKLKEVERDVRVAVQSINDKLESIDDDLKLLNVRIKECENVCGCFGLRIWLKRALAKATFF